MNSVSKYDVIIIGGGVSGILFLRQAVQDGLRCVLLEKENELGGLWGKLPSWQDIQIRPEDWTLNGISIEGVTQPHILQNIREWTKTYSLSGFILTNCAVNGVLRLGKEWQVNTTDGTLLASNLVVATGLQNTQFVPKIDRREAVITEFHSSSLLEPKVLAGKSVTVVGGGASAFDCIELAFLQGASEVHWVYRSTRWFLPTKKPKYARSDLRRLAKRQMWEKSTAALSIEMNEYLNALYRTCHFEEILPEENFDYRFHTPVPGRARMLERYSDITRHRGEISLIQKNKVLCSNQDDFQTDILIWATGYSMNLSFLQLPEYAAMKSQLELKKRCGNLVKALDYPNLFFIGPTLNDLASSITLAVAIAAKSVVAHIRGKITISDRVIEDRLHQWDIVELFAQTDRYNYPPFLWRWKHKLLTLWYDRNRNSTIKV